MVERDLYAINGKTMVTSSKITVFEVTLADDASAVGAYMYNIQSSSTLLTFPFTKKEIKEISIIGSCWC